MTTNDPIEPPSRILLTGATGFVGRHVRPALVAAGYDLRCGTRDLGRARLRHGDWGWVGMDVEDRASVEAALEGCEAAIYLVHQMRAGADYPERERRCAEGFVAAAEAGGIRRIVYLGGVAPSGGTSRHLESRLRTGEILRSGGPTTIELRAAMIIGRGSESWRMVRDLARRLPAMVLPRWLRNRSCPVAIDDVVAAILASLRVEASEEGFFEVPGPELLTHRDVIYRASRLVRGKRPLSINVPVLTPRLSSYWIALVTSVDLAMAKELVEGVRFDLEPTGPTIWSRIPGYEPMRLEAAVRMALVEERSATVPSSEARARLEDLGAGLLAGSAA